ncbi:hypothetical protein DITRI_Ditri07aG0088000 [Diplodiscus trichospermus]
MDNKEIYFSRIYGCNDGRNRRRLWDHLNSLNASLKDKQWMMAGDFNVALHPSESSNFQGSLNYTMDMKEFGDCLNQIWVFDHSFSGVSDHSPALIQLNTGELVEKEHKLNYELQELLLAEESFYKQKSKVQWIKEEDQNTGFFHKSVNAKNNLNTVRCLTNLDGDKLTSYD